MFKKRKISKNQINFISRIHDIFARLAAGNLSAQLHSLVHVQVASVKQMTYENFLRLLPVPTTLAIIDVGNLKGNAILEIDPTISFSIIDRLCGGTGGRTEVLYELTDIETSLMEGIIVRIMENMRDAWSMATDIKPSLNQIDTNPMFVQIVSPKDMVVMVSLETTVGDVKGKMNICIPHFTAELLMDKPSGESVNKTTSAENNKLTNKEDVLANLSDEVKELKQNFLGLRDELNSKISCLLKENKNTSEEKGDKQVQGQESDVQENDRQYTNIIELLSSAVKNHAENVVELIRIYLEQDDRSKAAIFLIALGSELSVEIFKLLREDELDVLTFDIARLGMIDYKQKTAILKEFYELYTANQHASIGGIDYIRVLLEGSVGAQKAIEIINRLTASLQVRPFDFIRRTDPAHLLNFIRQEHPQIIALVLSYLTPYNASIILQNLPREIQSDIARRIATMDRTSPEVLREVERVLEKKLSTLSDVDYMAAGGMESIVEILNLVDRSSEKQIIEALENEDPKFAEEIKKRMWVFEDIVMLDDRAIQRLLREVDAQELAKALKSIDVEVQDKIFRNMSKRAAGALKEDMDYMGPIRLKDVEEAQQKIISVIRRLEDSGEIVIARAGEDELVV